MSGHTPGPWRAVFNGCYWQVEPADKRPEDPWQIGDVCSSNPGNPACGLQKANANLFAAAPDLLAACKMALVRGRIDDSESAMNQLAAAIEAAEGAAP